jgi:hypothetical protein
MTPAYKPQRPRAEGNVHRITAFGTRVRFAVISLAKREAREAVKRRLRAEGKVKAQRQRDQHAGKRVPQGVRGGTAGASGEIGNCAEPLGR